jgi:hypothetical protein
MALVQTKQLKRSRKSEKDDGGRKKNSEVEMQLASLF